MKYFGIVIGLLWSSQSLAQVSRNELEERFRSEVSQINDNINVDIPNHEPSLGVRLLALAKQAGVSQQEAQTMLLKLVDEGLRASNASDAWLSRRAANGSLSALGDIADATILDRIVTVAETAPPDLMTDAVRAAVKIANRGSPSLLPTITHKLLQSPAKDKVYPLLHDVLQFNLSGATSDREQRAELIIDLFKEGLRNPDYEDRIYLDKVIEEYDPAFRRSDERRRILRELADSTNPIVKHYADGKLQEYFSTPAPVASVAKTDKPESAALLATARLASVSRSEVANSSTRSQRITIYGALGAALAIGLLAYILRKS